MNQHLPYEPYIVPLALKLRKRMTYSERILWNILKGKAMMGYDFHRQKPVLRYIVDFYCPELMLAIEVDGITHLNDGQESFDRQAAIEALGVSFIRINALDVKHKTNEVKFIIASWIEAWEERNGVPEIVLKRRKK